MSDELRESLANLKVITSNWYVHGQKQQPLEVIIKPEALDTSALVEGEGNTEYRPKTWSEYIGQDIAKDRVQGLVDGCKKHNKPFPHIFLSAPPGHGKTLFASILGNQLNRKVIVTTGGELKSEQIFIDKVVESDGGIILIDEANRINKKVGFYMLPLMETFELYQNGEKKKLKPFVLILASTHKGDLAKDLDALLQRCLSIDLEAYNQEQLVTIVKQYSQKEYPNVFVADPIFNELAKNSRQTPRIVKNLLREYIYVENLNKVLENNQIIKNGITKTDIEVLKYLSRNESGAGKDSIAKFLRMKPQTFVNEVETYLIFQEFIEISSRRKLTQKGKDFLKDL